ncbi:PREDICTED: pentatricopeptide repeat-containing protein At1g10270-like [Camelina sativa]|uniref:Pentatricopeptide repeat-containing protein At1g10270-like n=1 Tax=Camelina sativa TaxID=90675 RepID=A0ABM0WMB0_CAMSA|nr:PREDICTED: pentatricopeptide repeat-containing protein At1g10270-like [Camelina sativa]
MCKAERYGDALDLASYFFVEHKMIPVRYSFNRILKALFEDSSKFQARTTLLGIKRLAQDGEFDEAMYPSYTRNYSYPIRKGFWPFGKGLDVSNSLIRGFLDLGDFEEAHKLFEALKVRDGYYNLGNTAKFMEYWLKQGIMKVIDGEPTGTHALLQVLLDYGKKTEAWELFDHLLDDDSKKVIFRCDTDTLNLMVNECFKMGRFYAAIHTFKRVRPHKMKRQCQQQEKLYQNIIARFCEVGLLYEAERFFAEMRSLNTINPDVSSYTTLMDAYIKAGRVEDVVRISNQMIDHFLGHVAQLSLEPLQI